MNYFNTNLATLYDKLRNCNMFVNNYFSLLIFNFIYFSYFSLFTTGRVISPASRMPKVIELVIIILFVKLVVRYKPVKINKAIYLNFVFSLLFNGLLGCSIGA